MIKKAIITIVLMIAMTSMSCLSYAAELESGQASSTGGYLPMWIGMSDYNANLSITAAKAVCAVIVKASSSKVDKVGFNVNLQQYKNGSWLTIKSWSTTVSLQAGSGTFQESYGITKGYNYRFTAAIKTYKGGALLDNCSVTSDEEAY